MLNKFSIILFIFQCLVTIIALKKSINLYGKRYSDVGVFIVGDDILTPKERYPKMSKLSTKPSRRRITSRSNRNGKLRGSSVIAELVKPSIGRANKMAKRLFRRKPRTAESLRIQAEHSRQSQLVNSIQDLAKSNGGEVSDEEVLEMMSHISAKPIIPASFGDLVSTEAKNKPGDIASLPRLDE